MWGEVSVCVYTVSKHVCKWEGVLVISIQRIRFQFRIGISGTSDVCLSGCLVGGMFSGAKGSNGSSSMFSMHGFYVLLGWLSPLIHTQNRVVWCNWPEFCTTWLTPSLHQFWASANFAQITKHGSSHGFAIFWCMILGMTLLSLLGKFSWVSFISEEWTKAYFWLGMGSLVF